MSSGLETVSERRSQGSFLALFGGRGVVGFGGEMSQMTPTSYSLGKRCFASLHSSLILQT